MPKTYEPITTVDLNGVSSVTFSAIPATYTDLTVVVSGAIVIGQQNLYMRINGDTGTNYSRTTLSGQGGGESIRQANSSLIYLDRYAYFDADVRGTLIVQVMNYSNATTFKTILSRAGVSSVGTSAIVGMWRNTAAITSLLLNLSGSTFVSGSTATLYGIKAA